MAFRSLYHSSVPASVSLESYENGGKKPDEDEEEWKSLQENLCKRQKKEDDHSNVSYPVHAPFYPEVHLFILHTVTILSAPSARYF